MFHFPYQFEAMVEPHDLGTYRYTVVFLTDNIVPLLPFDRHPRLRISGEINDHPMTGAWQPSRGRWYLMLSKPLLRATRLEIGMFAEVRFRMEAQDEVELPASLVRALAHDSVIKTRFVALTPGKQRALSHRVLSAKTAPTEARRVAEVIAWLAAGESDIRRLGKL